MRLPVTVRLWAASTSTTVLHVHNGAVLPYARVVVVLIPVVIPDHLRHRLLHNHIDSVLSAALRSRTDLVVARVPIALGEGARRG